MPENLRLNICLNVKEIYQKYGLKNILRKRIEKIEKAILQKDYFIKEYSRDPSIESLINKQFTPSKTAQNGLNFVTKGEEESLCSKEQPEEIINIFKLIYILVGQDYTNINPQKLIEHLIVEVFPILGVENISKIKYYKLYLESLFLNYISKNTDFTDKQYEEMIKIIHENPKILSSSDLLKLSRSVSYMTFILKELYEFSSQKTNDGTSLFSLRKAKKELNGLNEKLSILKSYFN